MEKTKKYRTKISRILRAYFFLFLFSINYIKDEDVLLLINSRRKDCEDCPLRKGNWCSTQKVRLVGKDIVSGCGCWLTAKYFDNVVFETPDDNPCPLKKWNGLKL